MKRYDARGNTTCYTYDSVGRTSSVVYSGPGSTGVNKYFAYDSAIVHGQTMVNATEKMAEAYTSTSVNGTKLTDLGFSYDLTGRVTDVYESTPNSGGYYHTTATYYGNGTVKTLGGVPGKPTWNFGLDPMGRFNTLSETSGCNGTCLTLVSSASYSFGRPTSVAYGSGDQDQWNYSSTTGMESSYSLTQNSKSVADTLTWFPTGQLQKQAFSDTVTPANAQTCTYTYDDLLRLTGDNCGLVWSQTFTYDAFGNMAKTGNMPFVATYNNKNQISNLSSTYDSSGNLLTINTGTLHTYVWDAENRVASIDGKTLTYDALDRVVEEGPTLQILYGPTGKLGVQRGQTNTRTYLELPKGAGIIYDGSSVVYQHPDLMGNGILGTNNTKGKVFDRFFAPFGEVYNNSGATVADFTGNTQDLDANLYDFTFREESPAQGRWLNPDPSGMSAVSLGDPQTLNRYAYVRGSAMGLTDVNGLSIGVDRGFWAYITSADNYPGDGGNNMVLPAWYVAEVQAGQVNLAARAAQRPLTAKQIQKMFYKKYGKQFNAAMRAQVKATRPQDLSKFPEQSGATAPKLDLTHTRAELGKMSGTPGERDESRNRPDVANGLVQNGTILIAKETVASGNFNAIAGDYAHELGDLVDFQMNAYLPGPHTEEKNYGDPNYKDPNTGEPDPDTGAQVEIRMFGSAQY